MPRPPGSGPPRIALEPHRWAMAVAAVEAGGGEVVAPEEAEALVWLDWRDPDALAALLDRCPGVSWVHLPGAGIEVFVPVMRLRTAARWTCSKGAHSALIAEHALALALAALHGIPAAARTSTWADASVLTLTDQPVAIVGGGGIATALVGLLAPFGAHTTVVRRQDRPVPGAQRTLTTASLHEAIGDARVVFLALALTPETKGIVGAAELAAMPTSAWLVNVSRGGHVDTDALVEALKGGEIAGAALDVTDPEPLPEGHALWSLPNCVVTPHSAGNARAVMQLLGRRIEENVRCFGAGEELLGVVDPETGY